MDQPLQIVQTADGSNTIYNAQVGENYHSRNGALQESRHVFVNSGLVHFLEDNPVDEVSIFEVGFGTGLNFLLSANLCTARGLTLHYTGVEAYPLSQAMISETGYEQYTAVALWQQFISNYPASLVAPAALNTCTELRVVPHKLLEVKADKQFDIIYFDAFAAANQPEMWNEKTIGHTVNFLKPNGVFVTYAITGNLKRMLKSMGLKIEKIPGAAGKREMLRACRCAD